MVGHAPAIRAEAESAGQAFAEPGELASLAAVEVHGVGRDVTWRWRRKSFPWSSFMRNVRRASRPRRFASARLGVCAKITSDFGGSATGPDARPEGGSVSPEILDRPRNEADGPVSPRPGGLGGFGSLASLLLGHRPLRVCSLVAPRQRAKSPPAKPELIFAQTLSTQFHK